MLGTFRGIWEYKHFILSSIRYVVMNRFARSKLGSLWSLFNPLAQVLIYALILSNVLGAKLPEVENQYAYSIYLMAGLLVWNLFSEVISRSLNLFIEQGNLMKKVCFPRGALPAIVLGSCLFNNFMLLFSMLGVTLLLGHSFTLNILWLIPLTLIVMGFSIGMGLILGILNVFIRDIGHAMPIILQVWFWFTPIIYPLTIIPENYRYLLFFNPLYPFVAAYQQVLVYGKTPDLSSLSIMMVISILLMMLSFIIFRKANAEMVDVL